LHAELQSFEGLYLVYMRIWGKYGGTELYTTAWSTFWGIHQLFKRE